MNKIFSSFTCCKNNLTIKWWERLTNVKLGNSLGILWYKEKDCCNNSFSLQSRLDELK